jgi:hypothetical protein
MHYGPLTVLLSGRRFVLSTAPSTAFSMKQSLFRLACLSLAFASVAAARAGGGPENLFLVVNASSPDSVAVANAYADLRAIPPINVLMLPWQESTESVGIATFRSDLLDPVLQAIDGRRLAPQIDCVVYSTDFPWRIDFPEEMPESLKTQQLFKFPSGSLTGMTMLYGAVRSGQGPVWLDPQSNRYWRPLDAEGVPKSTDGFRGWHRYGPKGEVTEDAGNRYLLSVMLGVTAGRGNLVPEIVRGLEASAAADGTTPPGTVYFVTNDDVRTKTRSQAFPPIVRALEALGVKAEIVSGVLPSEKRDVAGLMTGSPTFDWPACKSTIVPGAICENLTSLGAVFTEAAGQTPLSVFIRAGAAGSSGTVIEPYALQEKFPHPAIHVHYARGATLAEAFYQSVQAPYQLLVVGDPLCRPWATIPQVQVATAGDGKGLVANGTLSGRIELLPQATVAKPKPPRVGVAGGGEIADFTLFVDGVQLAQCRPGERLPLDTAQLADGHHELRVVARESSSVRSQGRWMLPVRFANHGRSLVVEAEPPRVSVAGTVRVRVAGEGLDGVAVFSMGRVLGRTAGGDTTIEVPAELLGRGRVTIRATGRSGPGAANSVNADPVTVEVTER